uniref:histidine--tRNA ligase n=1 Tax=Ndongobacter massiliensis TaxID=1871025 RepID=UPI000931D161|nr:histidine--tRNA ligase [Ndongobacter massiliensis]
MSETLISPSIPSGFMELLPAEQVLFDRMRQTIENTFQIYGFWPLDTPLIEKNEILFSKGGGETTKQIYRIEKLDGPSEQSLRFDLTVPLARYVAQHAGELAFPFRRYQIGKVYRGERSQRGRYREFYQCDIDIIGRDQLALPNDAEIPSVIRRLFHTLALPPATFHMNNRRLLNGIFAYLGIERSEDALRAIDKLPKIGEEKVRVLLMETGVQTEAAEALFTLLRVRGNADVIQALRDFSDTQQKKAPNEDARTRFEEGLSEFVRVYELMQAFGIPEEEIALDLSITRGLDYYTGTVFETFLRGYESIGSVCSGGRYDNLASNFTKEHLPGIGVSIGLTRLFYQLQAAGLLQEVHSDYLQVLVVPMGEDDLTRSIEVINALRDIGVRCQIYLESGKMKKKFGYADRLHVPYVVTIGESERREQRISVKDLATGEQESFMLDAFLSKF